MELEEGGGLGESYSTEKDEEESPSIPAASVAALRMSIGVLRIGEKELFEVISIV